MKRNRRAGLRVRELRTKVERFSTVRAILQQDGSGRVQLDKPCHAYDGPEASACKDFLLDLGYAATGCREYMMHSTSKFWLTNKLGSLTVFPQQIGMQQLHQLLCHDGGKKWHRFNNDTAFFLPVLAP